MGIVFVEYKIAGTINAVVVASWMMISFHVECKLLNMETIILLKNHLLEMQQTLEGKSRPQWLHKSRQCYRSDWISRGTEEDCSLDVPWPTKIAMGILKKSH